MAKNHSIVNIKEDNQGMIVLTKNLIFFDRLKHIIIHYYNI
jgi:hypothetical protein